jgi:hypothetical protein
MRPASSIRLLPDRAFWLLPVLVCLFVHWYGLWAGFHQDDWVWLGQSWRVHSWQDTVHAIFSPAGHGTFRPFSERLTFLISGTLFGTWALPFRILAFVTQAANLVLLAMILRRLTGSIGIGVLASILWIVNSALSLPMAWSSAYMQILCAFCILLAFYFLLLYLESGRKLYYVLQWLVFLFGLGVMESIIVYPGIATLYVLLFRRRYWRHVLPLVLAAGVFVLFHMSYAPKVRTGPYSMHFDASILSTLGEYARRTLIPSRMLDASGQRYAAAVLAAAAGLLCLLAYTLWKLRNREYLPLFFAGVFVGLLVPVLPLRDHISDYYLFIPAAAFGAWAALAAGEAALRAGWGWRLLAAVLVSGYLWVQLPDARFSTRWWYERSRRINEVLSAMAVTRQVFPDRTIVLQQADDELLFGGIWDGGLFAHRAEPIFLGAQPRSRLLEVHPEGEVWLERHHLTNAEAREAATAGNLLVLRAQAGTLREVPPDQAIAQLQHQPPAVRLDLGGPAARPFLGPGWYEAEGDHRWMSGEASLWLEGPFPVPARLLLTAYLPEQVANASEVTLTVAVNGVRLESRRVKPGVVSAWFPLPQNALAAERLQVTLQLSRTFRIAGDTRALGLSFGRLEVVRSGPTGSARTPE